VTLHHSRTIRGVTLLEALLALVILSVATMTLAMAMQSASRIRLRGRHIAFATNIARNEIEHMRRMGTLNETITDSTWEERVNNLTFFVNRKVLNDEFSGFGLFVEEQKTAEVALSVTTATGDTVGVWRLLQGYRQ